MDLQRAVPQRRGGARPLFELLDRPRAHPPLRHVDNPQQARLVGGVCDDAQVRDDVFDLLAVIELHAADYLIGDALCDERLLDAARKPAHAVEYGDVTRGCAVPYERGGALGDELGLFVVVVGLEKPNTFPLGVRRVELTGLSAEVVGHHRVGRGDYGLRRAIVAVQKHDLCLGEILIEVEHIAYVGAPPAVDGLIGVAACGQVSVVDGQEPRRAWYRS